MTNLQLLLAIGIPSLLIVLSWIQQGSRIGRLEASTDRGFQDVDRKFQDVDLKMDSLRSETIALRDSIHRDMVSLHERVAVVEAKHAS